MSGPSFAKEMVSGHPISVVVASRDSWCSGRVSSIMHSERFRVYVTDDVIGPCLASPRRIFWV
jgi:glycerol-3-phosphate dehydrogenase (NAD(P)+)